MRTRYKAPVKVSESFDKAAENSKKRRKAKASSPFSIRLSVDERAYLDGLAGDQSLGAYIREVLLGDRVKKRRILRKPKMEDIQYAMLLSALGQSRLSANVNQLAKHANMGTLDCSQDVEQQLEDACAALFAMRNALFLALGYRPNGKGDKQ